MALVLVVDDEPLIRRSVRIMLERAGHAILESANASEALGLCERSTPDILITDLHMPGGSGLELARAFRESGRRPSKVIILSGDDGQTVRDQAATVGATALMKPFTHEELLAAVAKVSGPPPRAVHVLVVDDQPDVCLGFRYMLEADHFQVTNVLSGREALAHLEREPVDVVLMDIHMPEMDGLTLLRHIRNLQTPRLRTIAMTGSAMIDRAAALENALLLGAKAVLEKPISRQQLLRTIHSVIEADPRSS